MKLKLVLLSLMLTACIRPGVEKLDMQNLPDELSDCKFYRLSDESGTQTLIVRCINSTAIVQPSNKTKPSIVIDQPASAVQPSTVPATPQPKAFWRFSRKRSGVM